MKNNWQTKKLGEVCEYVGRGISPKYTKSDGLVILNQRCIRNHKVGLEEAQLHDIKLKSVSDEKLLKMGDVLVNSTGVGTLGRVAMFDKSDIDATVDSHVSIVRPTKGLFDPSFFGKVMILIEDRIKQLGSGASGQIELSRTILKEIEISFPNSISEQKRIVKKLDEIFENIDKAKKNTEKNLQNSKELFESCLDSYFVKQKKGWEDKKIKEIGQTQTGSTPKTSIRKYFGNFIPFIKPADVDFDGNGTVRYENERLSEDGLKVSRIVTKNSVLMVCIGATIGKVGFTIQDITCNQQINTLTPDDKYNPKIFYYIMRTKSFFNKIMNGSSQATLPIINKGKWENTSISFPVSITVQGSIVKKLDELSEQTKKLEENYKQKLLLLEELKKSVLTKAFAGEL